MTESTTTILAQIRALLDSGAGDGTGRLPTERALSVRLGVGRRELRQALDVLQAEGLIWRRQGKGTFLGQPPDPTGVLAADIVAATDALSVMEARLCIEPELAALCARRASPEDISRMRHLAARLSPASSAESAEIWDGALHRMIARAAGNPILLTAFSLIDEVRIRADWQKMRHRARSPEAVTLYNAQHDAIIDAIARGKATDARGAMTAHLMQLRENLEKSLVEADE